MSESVQDGSGSQPQSGDQGASPPDGGEAMDQQDQDNNGGGEPIDVKVNEQEDTEGDAFPEETEVEPQMYDDQPQMNDHPITKEDAMDNTKPNKLDQLKQEVVDEQRLRSDLAAEVASSKQAAELLSAVANKLNTPPPHAQVAGAIDNAATAFTGAATAIQEAAVKVAESNQAANSGDGSNGQQPEGDGKIPLKTIVISVRLAKDTKGLHIRSIIPGKGLRSGIIKKRSTMAVDVSGNIKFMTNDGTIYQGRIRDGQVVTGRFLEAMVTEVVNGVTLTTDPIEHHVNNPWEEVVTAFPTNTITPDDPHEVDIEDDTDDVPGQEKTPSRGFWNKSNKSDSTGASAPTSSTQEPKSGVSPLWIVVAVIGTALAGGGMYTANQLGMFGATVASQQAQIANFNGFLSGQNQSLLGQIGELEAQLDAAQHKVNNAEAQVQVSRNQVTQLNKKLTKTSTANFDRINRKLQNAQKRYADARAAEKRAIADLTALEKTLKEAEKHASNAKGRLGVM